MKTKILIVLTGLIIATSGFSQATWIGGTGDLFGEFVYTETANWSPNATPASNIAITMNSSDALGLDLAGDFVVSSLTVSAGYNASMYTYGSQSLYIGSGGITLNNNSSLQLDTGVLTTANASQTWNIGSNSLILTLSLNVQSGTTLTVNLGSGGTFGLGSDGGASWGGTMSIVGATTPIVLSGAFLGTNVDKITINGAMARIEGGALTSDAIPEASTYALVLGGLALMGALWRRRSA